jgi:RNA polymerase sigma-70 factor (ECF subfamily)
MGSFDVLFRQQYPFVCQVIHKYIADRTKVEDIAQELFAELWMKREQILIHTSISSYIRRMAVSRALNYIRDTKKHDWDELDPAVEGSQMANTQLPSVILMLEEQEMQKKLDAALGRLPEKCRIVFLMSRYDEMSYAEISQQLDISVKTVENQIGKALKLLRSALAGDRG